MTQEERDERDKKLVLNVLMDPATTEEQKEDYAWLADRTGIDEPRLRTVLHRLGRKK